jgi:hypothetical protein
MFEAGKTYRRMITPKSVDPTIIEVLHATAKSAHIRIVKGVTSPFGLPGCEHCYQQTAFEYWEEYREPVIRRVTKRLLQFKGKDISESLHTIPTDFAFRQYNDYIHYGKIEFVFTDDKLTDVRIVE